MLPRGTMLLLGLMLLLGMMLLLGVLLLRGLMLLHGTMGWCHQPTVRPTVRSPRVNVTNRWSGHSRMNSPHSDLEL